MARAGGDERIPGPVAADVLYCVERARRYFPRAGDIYLERAWAGQIDATPDALPVIDAPASPGGLVLATGLSGHGFGLSPVVGEIVARLAAGREAGFDLGPFRLSGSATAHRWSPPTCSDCPCGGCPCAGCPGCLSSGRRCSDRRKRR